MSGKKKNVASPGHEDFITSKPETIMFVGERQMELLDEHVDIIGALIGKNLTVKEIHRLYLVDTEGPTYSKTLKTVYRHLNALEKADLVRVAGHRKYEGSRQTEKLYCRSARIYFQQDPKGPKWWETIDGQRQLDQLGKLAVKFFDIPSERSKQIKKLVQQYYDNWGQVVRELFEKIAEEETLADIFGDADIGEIKEQSRIVGMLGAISQSPELFKNMRKVISEQE
ncbi:MAG: helix-turn-helix transcriptional regulator [Candidatus Thorarchaeota archaeon]|nr:MAG: helix-turn-helix transcriptional regulator [Candidatus Thorarchaeota archaeon]